MIIEWHSIVEIYEYIGMVKKYGHKLGIQNTKVMTKNIRTKVNANFFNHQQ